MRNYPKDTIEEETRRPVEEERQDRPTRGRGGDRPYRGRGRGVRGPMRDDTHIETQHRPAHFARGGPYRGTPREIRGGRGDYNAPRDSDDNYDRPPRNFD